MDNQLTFEFINSKGSEDAFAPSEPFCDEVKAQCLVDVAPAQDEQEGGYAHKCDKRFLAAVRRAVRYFWGRPQFSFVSMDRAMLFEDMVAEVAEKAMRKSLFQRDTAVTDAVVFCFVKQIFITKAVYQTRHFKDELLQDEVYHEKVERMKENIGDCLAYDSMRRVELSSEMDTVKRLSEKPLVEGLVDGREISKRSVVSLVMAGNTLADITKAYDGPIKDSRKVRRKLDAVFQLATKELSFILRKENVA